jgi:hypothetical protein
VKEVEDYRSNVGASAAPSIVYNLVLLLSFVFVKKDAVAPLSPAEIL